SRLPRHARGDARELPVGDLGGHAAVTDPARAAQAVEQRLGARRPAVAIVLGSGLGFLADEVRDPLRIRYADIPGFPEPGVAGHKGELVAGLLEKVPVLVQAGRFHLYEGHDAATAALPVRVFARLGVKTLIVTNAASGLTAQPLSHQEVLAASAAAGTGLVTVVKGVLRRLS